MKPFIWITALIFSCPFLAGAAFIAFDVLSKPNLLTNPDAKVAGGWLFTGVMFLSLGLRGWRAHRRIAERKKTNG